MVHRVLLIIVSEILIINAEPAEPATSKLKRKLINAGCWALNNHPETIPIDNANDYPLKLAVLPYFEVLVSVDDKAQT